MDAQMPLIPTVKLINPNPELTELEAARRGLGLRVNPDGSRYVLVRVTPVVATAVGYFTALLGKEIEYFGYQDTPNYAVIYHALEMNKPRLVGSACSLSALEYTIVRSVIAMVWRRTVEITCPETEQPEDIDTFPLCGDYLSDEHELLFEEQMRVLYGIMFN